MFFRGKEIYHNISDTCDRIGVGLLITLLLIPFIKTQDEIDEAKYFVTLSISFIFLLIGFFRGEKK